MAYDEGLAARVRDVLAPEPGLTERTMFGGIGFMLDGHMAVGVSGQGGLMLRVPPDDTDALLEEPHVESFEMRGKAMAGWLRVMPAGVESEDELERWVAIGVAYVRRLPPKGS